MDPLDYASVDPSLNDFDGGLARYDEYAQQSLSHYAYHNVWLMTVRKSCKLQFKSTDESLSFIVCSVGELQKEHIFTMILKKKMRMSFSSFISVSMLA